MIFKPVIEQDNGNRLSFNVVDSTVFGPKFPANKVSSKKRFFYLAAFDFHLLICLVYFLIAHTFTLFLPYKEWQVALKWTRMERPSQRPGWCSTQKRRSRWTGHAWSASGQAWSIWATLASSTPPCSASPTRHLWWTTATQATIGINVCEFVFRIVFIYLNHF